MDYLVMVPAEGLAPGLYLVRVETENRVISGKKVVLR
jgi:hypothetical protein